MIRKHFSKNITRKVVTQVGATILFVFSIFTLSSCSEKQLQTNTKVIIWTSCSEFAQYAELFNKTHSNTQVQLVYKENPAISLPPAKDEVIPDIIVGSWLRTDSSTKYFKSLDYLFDRKNLTSDIFYPQLLAAGKVNYNQILLPVSFNLPAIIFSTENTSLVQSLIDNNYTVTLEQLRTAASSYNKKNKAGKYLRMGFIPSNNTDFLYLTTKLFDVNFSDNHNQIIWDQEKLNQSTEYLKEWITTENSGYQTEKDFAFKYLFMPDYRQVTSDKTLFAYTTSNKLFKTLKDQVLDIDYRWITTENSIPAEDSFIMMGIYKEAQNQPGATEFITWFCQSENQDAILARKTSLHLNTEMFGIADGFSAIRDVTEHIIPVYYTQLLTNLPTANMITPPQKLPARWDSYKNAVVEPYINACISSEVKSEGSSEEVSQITIADLEKEWRKKVFD
ncbi:MAG: hypothetical protein MJ188_05780 [Treponema sp.]|nr:hypothetical protein [Treponema sp.]